VERKARQNCIEFLFCGSKRAKIVVVHNVVISNPKIMHGVPCFAGTRVPAQSLFDHLKRGYTVDEFLEQFPTVKRGQIDALLDESSQKIRDGAAAVAR
jgi:uncharacterized protein (DUF433 family)